MTYPGGTRARRRLGAFVATLDGVDARDIAACGRGQLALYVVSAGFRRARYLPRTVILTALRILDEQWTTAGDEGTD